METRSNNQFLIPLSIVGAGIIIALAIVFVNFKDTAQLAANGAVEEKIAPNIKPVTAKDHILGNFKTAEVFLVEFSDLECPFCKMFHKTLKQVMEEYGPNGKVAWVYRHFPLESLHPKAFKEAEATECAAELGGELKFWEYTDRLFEITPSNNGLDLALLPVIAKDVGLNVTDFNKCLESGKWSEKVNANLQDALGSGGRGTPHTILVTKDGKSVLAIQGAQPIESLRDAIEQVLNK
ncbi:MAG: thioredoxin domain-containing protein [bacterium]|nr:thioredoxin domain-containing protein [bacterium]